MVSKSKGTHSTSAQFSPTDKLHKWLGSIVRINPAELSIHDPEFYNELYVTESKRRTESYDAFCKGIDHEGK